MSHSPVQRVQIAEPVTFLPAAERIVAIGDLHGDLDKTKRALRLGGLIDEAGNWTGGQTVAVQVSCHPLLSGKVQMAVHSLTRNLVSGHRESFPPRIWKAVEWPSSIAAAPSCSPVKSAL